jgi:DNA invertase Pin-like site-specific DNA recombinase
MANGKFVSYCRVSTQMQGASGLGLEAQQQAIMSFLNGGDWQLLGEFVEIESGKKNDRPKLQAALDRCAMTGATLAIAKLDRLARNVAFISRLMESGVDFVAVDFPTANRLTVHILAAVAEHEGKMISERTKSALTARKARGLKCGNPRDLTSAEQAKGSASGNRVKQKKADAFAIKIAPIIKHYLAQGLSLAKIAGVLNADGILTARGKDGSWTATAVKNVLGRSA